MIDSPHLFRLPHPHFIHSRLLQNRVPQLNLAGTVVVLGWELVKLRPVLRHDCQAGDTKEEFQWQRNRMSIRMYV